MKMAPIFLFLSLSLACPNFANADSLILGPADFDCLDEGTEFSKTMSYICLDTSSPSSVFLAPVSLPDGVRVTSVVVFYEDSDDSGGLTVRMHKQNIYTGDIIRMADWSSIGTSGGYTSHKITPISGGSSVNNSGYLYTVYLSFTIGSGVYVKLHKVKINYQ